MSTFIEVDSVDKGCKVIINLDQVLEIAPLIGGGCILYFADQAAVGGKASYKVRDSYLAFKQFAMETVSAEDIAKRFPTKKSKTETTMEIPKL